jgi:hypothetical protein
MSETPRERYEWNGTEPQCEAVHRIGGWRTRCVEKAATVHVVHRNSAGHEWCQENTHAR